MDEGKSTVLQWCAQHAILPAHFANVKMIFGRLSDGEAAAQHVAITTGSDPRPVNGFEAMGALWQANGDERPTMRTDDREIFEVLMAERQRTS